MSYKIKGLIVVIIGIIVCGTLLLSIAMIRHLIIEGPLLSRQSGFYESAFKLQIFSFPGSRIYYTLDGTEPTTSSFEYCEPIDIKDASKNANVYANMSGLSGIDGDYFPNYIVDKATVVKSVAVFGNYQSDVSVGVYFVGFQNKNEYNDLKIMSMVVNPEDLFSDEGIYVVGKLAGEPDPNIEYNEGNYPANYNIESKEMQRLADIILWDSDRNILVEEKLKIGIHGGWSKSFRQKGFNFYSNKIYEQDEYKLGKYMLRTSGYRDTFQTMFRDVLNQELIADRDVATQKSSPCILFINGEYWGIYNLQERYNETYFQDNYDIDEDNIIVVKLGNISQGKENDIEKYNELIFFANNYDLSIQENYNEISKMMDIQSFIDYYCAECYIANIDWPINNNCCFRSRKIKNGSIYEDGRWRWALFDTDDSDNIVGLDIPNCMGTTNSNPFLKESHFAGNPAETELMLALRQNKSFCKQFEQTFIEMANTTFDYKNVKNLIDKYSKLYRQQMTMTQNRFNTMEYTTQTFDNYVADVDEFFKNRKKYVVPYMEEVFDNNE